MTNKYTELVQAQFLWIADIQNECPTACPQMDSSMDILQTILNAIHRACVPRLQVKVKKQEYLVSLAKLDQLQDVEIEIVRLSQMETMIKIPSAPRGFVKATELLSSTKPQGVVEARPDHAIEFCMMTPSDFMKCWAARIPEGFGLKIKLRS